MSSSIWTRCAGASELGRLWLTAWRAVEAQHQVSTRKLVDSAEEQAVLEELIDRAKPPDRSGGSLHYLLFTPFRYPPLRHGSRFGTRFERSLWYGSMSRGATFAEVAYYRLLFLEGSRADLGTVSTALTVFTVRARSARGIDLTAPPFEKYRRAIASPVTYRHSQALGAAMRRDGVELFRYPSARDKDGGVNVAAFTPSVFGGAQPQGFETWHCIATRHSVEIVKRDYFTRGTHVFGRDEFLVDGTLHAPAP
jgi:hypothetical protein